MKHFKVKASRYAERYEITRENFERVTGCKEPFEQIKDTGRASQYAICPSCLNPIQIIGLVQEIKSKPYGRHSGKNIKLNGIQATTYCRMKGNMSIVRMRIEINADNLMKMNFCVRLQTA